MTRTRSHPLRLPFAAVAAIGALSLSACATTTGFGAANDVRALALALQTRDLAGIEARIDRPALEAQVSSVARSIAADRAARELGGGTGARIAGIFAADLAGPVIDALTRRALQPDTLADFARQAGLTPDTRIPGRAATAIALDPIGPDRVCAPDPATRRCLLYFGRSAGGWRLDGVSEEALRRRLAAN